MSETIMFNFNEQIATVTLSRTDRLNSFNVPVHEVLCDALEFAEDPENSVRASLITGTEK